MAEFTLVIGNKNYSSWSLRGWLMARIAGIDFEEIVVPLDLPSQAPTDVALLRGCWRTDVFVYENHTGITTWCFNDRGTGRVLYSRIDQPDYACNAMAQARVAGQGVVLRSLEATCSDGRALPLGELDCRQGNDHAQCSGSLPTLGPGETWRVGLYRVQR